MEVHGPASVGRSAPVFQAQIVQAATAADTASPAMQAGDQVEISETARILDELSRMPEVRAEKVAHIRRAIQAGSYETAEKLEIAVDRLLEEMRGR